MNSKFKIAVMGASGVGKTIFLGSFFYLMAADAEKKSDGIKRKRYVVVRSETSLKRIGEIISQLFDKREVVQGTDQRVDFSFSVDSLGMDIELFDVPGGHTTDKAIIDYWEKRKNAKSVHSADGSAGDIVSDLLEADGAMFFISGDDLVNHPEKVFTGDNQIFSKAIEIIRSERDGMRADVPIWFIFTKCDKIPDVSIKTLERQIGSLLKSATENMAGSGQISSRLIGKGKNVRTYMSQSLGVWKSDVSLPDEYRPVNVAESMVQLFETMKRARSNFRGTLFKAACFIAAAGICAVFGIAYWFDSQNAKSARDRVAAELARGEYARAVQILDSFKTPLNLDKIFAILPEAVRPENGMSELRYEALSKWEAALFAALEPVLKSVNTNDAVKLDAAFSRDLRTMEEYMGRSEFASINPDHYRLVSGSVWYFEAARLLGLAPNKSTKPEDIIEAVRQCMNYDIPAEWRDRVDRQIDRLLQFWGGTLPMNASVEQYDAYISASEQLAANVRLSQETKDYLFGLSRSLGERRLALMVKNAEDWAARALSKPLDEALHLLASHSSPDNPQEVKRILDEAENRAYSNAADAAVKGSDMSKLNEMLSRYPNMPSDPRGRIEARIAELRAQIIRKLASELSAAKSLNDLVKSANKLGEYRSERDLVSLLNDRLKAMTDAELRRMSAAADKAISGEKFAGGRSSVLEIDAALSSVLGKLTDANLANTYISSVDSYASALVNKLCDSHAAYCKQQFNRRRSTSSQSDVSACISILEAFVKDWPDRKSGSAGEVKEALNFLKVVRGGIKGKFIIMNGNFSAIDDVGGPDMKVSFTVNGSSYLTKTIHDTDRPEWQQYIDLTWNIGMGSISVKCIEEDVLVDDDVFSASINLSGFQGYENMTTTLRGAGCSLNVKFEPERSIPRCPW